MPWMKAAGIDAFGGEVRVLKLAAPASPAPDEVVISVRAAAARSSYKSPKRSPKFLIVVHDVGSRTGSPGSRSSV